MWENNFYQRVVIFIFVEGENEKNDKDSLEGGCFVQRLRICPFCRRKGGFYLFSEDFRANGFQICFET